jgi:nucleolar complex protein 3
MASSSSSDSDSSGGEGEFPEIELGDGAVSDTDGYRMENPSSDDEEGGNSIAAAWERRLAKSKLEDESKKKTRLPLKKVDGTIVRNEAFDGEGSVATKPKAADKRPAVGTVGLAGPVGPGDGAHKRDRKRGAAAAPATGQQRIDEEEAAMARLPRPVRLEQYKMKIATLAEVIMEEPSASLKHTKEEISKFDQIHKLCTHIDPTVRRLATISTYAVFKDVLPPYRIRVATDVEMQAQMKKETRALREFEKMLLAAYQRYLKALDSAAMRMHRGGGGSTGKSKGKSDGRRCHRLALAAVSCMGMLVRARPFFNYRSNILSLLVSRLSDADAEVQSASKDQIIAILKEDRNGELSLEIVRSISKLAKAKKYNISTIALDCLLELPLRVDLKDKNVQKQLTRPKKKRKLSAIDRSLQSTSGTVDKNTLGRNHANVLEDLFNMYFRVLKRSNPSSPLIGAAMHGVAKFSHLIDVELVHDLVDVLGNMTKADGMDLASGFQCVLAALRTLGGPGRELKMDDGHFIAYIFKLLPRLSDINKDKNIGTAMICLQMAFVKRREHSMERVAAFVKRLILLGVALACPEHIMAVISVARSLLVRYPQAAQLLDSEEERKACPAYLPKVDDPEHCNAFGATLWELASLTNHFHPSVCEMARDTLRLIDPLPQHQPRLLLKDYDTSACTLNPPIQPSQL